MLRYALGACFPGGYGGLGRGAIQQGYGVQPAYTGDLSLPDFTV